MTWRDTFERLERGDTSTFSVSGEGAPDPLSLANWLLQDEADDIEAGRGSAAARSFVGIARGMATPLLLHIDSWLREGGTKGPLTPRTGAQYRADLNDLAEWAKGIGITTVEDFTEVVAGGYVTEQLVGRGVHWATANRKITAASAYWRWLRKRAGIKAHPWAGQSLSKGSARSADKSKRPFLDPEVATLLAGDADAELADAMRVAALSGMRIEELYQLTVADCEGGWFRVRHAKTRAGVRRVPIHSGLLTIVTRRSDGKGRSNFLFHEPGPPRAGRQRSMALSKRFGRYRQGLGVHDQVEGARHSRVDFHSWRRWFVTTARNAGVDRATVAAVVGHATGTALQSCHIIRRHVPRRRAPCRSCPAGTHRDLPADLCRGLAHRAKLTSDMMTAAPVLIAGVLAI
jgi:site-specific recombinase XerD